MEINERIDRINKITENELPNEIIFKKVFFECGQQNSKKM